MTRILITGANGYIGGHLKRHLSNRYAVHTFSQLHSDIHSLDLRGVALVIHCAALVHKNSNDSYEAYKSINSDYPVELAKKSVKAGVPHFIFLSSFSVYGSAVSLVDCKTKPQPDNNYGRSKLLAEQRLLKIATSENIRVSILRLPMVYGPNAPGNISSLLKIVKLLPVLPLGGINNKRSLLSINNLKIYVDYIISARLDGITIAIDPRPVSTSEIVKALPSWFGNKPILFSFPILPIILRKIAPSLQSKIFGNLTAENSISMNSKPGFSLQDPATELNEFFGSCKLKRAEKSRGSFVKYK